MRLLDTDIMVDLQRRYPPALAWFASVSEAPGLPGFVVLELIQGCRNRQEVAAVRALVQPFTVFWPTAQDCERAVATYSRARLTHSLGIPDLLIGECAAGLGATLCTFNTRHFQAIPGLAIEQPYARS